ncbi:hypothetical protein niasHS_007868 [Heterodera schachtii]|uniref:Uncharacterized protein n=1 Tax=Heterodera schachtii TaxID=97005 RepID=A0ABD2JPY3_HETSC
MDFDPDHEIWKCCFCRIPTGLKILGLAECVLATAVLALCLHLIHVHSVTDKSRESNRNLTQEKKCFMSKSRFSNSKMHMQYVRAI